MKTSLIILTRNEIYGLKFVLRKIPFEAVDECFAVDYNSKDGTLKFLKEYKAPVINTGFAQALLCAVTWLRREPALTVMRPVAEHVRAPSYSFKHFISANRKSLW